MADPINFACLYVATLSVAAWGQAMLRAIEVKK